jgi:hypothetical protein
MPKPSKFLSLIHTNPSDGEQRGQKREAAAIEVELAEVKRQHKVEKIQRKQFEFNKYDEFRFRGRDFVRHFFYRLALSFWYHY